MVSASRHYNTVFPDSITEFRDNGRTLYTYQITKVKYDISKKYLNFKNVTVKFKYVKFSNKRIFIQNFMIEK